MVERDPAPVTEQHVAAHPFVRGLEVDDVAALQRLATAVEFESGDVIFSVGEPAEAFYLIRTGLVALELPDRSGMSRTIQTLTEGSALGWSWMFEPRRWQFTAVARTPVRSIAFDTGELRALFEAEPATGFRILGRVAELMAERLHATRRQVVELSGG